MKLSEFKALLKDHPNLDLDSLEDDETGKPLKDLRASNKAYTQETQKRAALEKSLQERDTQLQQVNGQLQQYQVWQQNAAAQAEAAKREATQQGLDWRTDPLYAPVVKYYDDQLSQATQIITRLSQGFAGMLQQYQADRVAVTDYLNRIEVREMKRQYPDFDEEKVREVAKRDGIQTWDGAYRALKAEQMPTAIEAARKEGRDAAFKEAQEKGAAPVVEMGTTGAQVPAVGEGQSKTYKDAWGGLAGELEKAGVVR